MKPSVLCCAILALISTACATPSHSRRRPGPGLEVAASFTEDARGAKTLPAWLLYAMKRRVYIDVTFYERAPKDSAYRYTFEEELDARDGLAGVWAEMRAKQSLTDPYLDEIAQVYTAGFLKEYVWHCVPHSAWTEPRGLRSTEFSAWLSEKLPQHRVETWVKTLPSSEGVRILVGTPAHEPTACALPSLSGAQAAVSSVD